MTAGSNPQDDGPVNVYGGERRSLVHRWTSMQERSQESKPASGVRSVNRIREGRCLPGNNHAFSQVNSRHLILAAIRYSAGKFGSDPGGGNSSVARMGPRGEAFLAIITDRTESESDNSICACD